MKKIFGLLSIFAFMLVAIPTQAQNPEKVGDPTSYMTAEQLAKYSSDMQIASLEKKLETYGNWVGVGGEVGNAIEEGLTAVVDVADKFTGTDVGKFTMVLVAWKVIGKDVVRIVLGIVFIIVITFLFFKVYRNTFVPKRSLIEKSNPGFFKYPKVKKWEVTEPEEWEGYNFVRIAILFLYAGAFGISYAIMFG